MKLWRIEHPDTGKGPYCPSEIQDERARTIAQDIADHHNHWTPDRTPTPSEDGLGWEVQSSLGFDFRFAFRNLDELNAWFIAEERERLWSAGFVVQLLEVPREAVRVGGHQVIYDPEKVVSSEPVVGVLA